MPELARPKILYTATAYTVMMVRAVGDTQLSDGHTSVQAALTWVEKDFAERKERLERYVRNTREDPESMYPNLGKMEGEERDRWIEETVAYWEHTMAPYNFYIVREHKSRSIIFTSWEPTDDHSE